MNPLDFSAGGLATALTLAIGGIIMLGSWIGVRVQAINLDQEVGPYGPLILTFSDPVDQSAVQTLLSLEPDVPSRFEWTDTKTVHLIPASPLNPGATYQLTFAPGQIGTNGEALRKGLSWTVRVRTPKIVYLSFGEELGQIWIVDAEGKSPQRLEDVDKKIFDFDAARNGDFIIFSALNDKNGVDLWFLDRSRSSHILLECGADRCTTPAISPDNNQIAYTRETAPISATMPVGAPRPWIVTIGSGENSPLYADSQIIGYSPGWSPDGKYITSYDGIKDLIQVVALDGSGGQFTLPCNTGKQPSWSPDSKYFIATNVVETSGSPRTQIQMVNIETGEVSIWMGAHDLQDYQYSELAWSPKQANIIVGMRADPDFPSHILWLAEPDSLSGPTIAGEPDYVYLFPRWDPWGISLIFSQLNLKAKYQPEIAIWKPGFEHPLVIANGTNPHWLP